MTTRDETRRGTADLRPESARADAARESSRDAARDASRSASDEPSMSLPERLYAARERKGVDLYRAERDTKIRARYLAALERGDYRELPGAVYTKGFLRNYALYLGLEPEEILDQWRRERGDAGAPQPVIAVPRPIDQPRPRADVLAGHRRRGAPHDRRPRRRGVPGRPGPAVRQAADAGRHEPERRRR